MIWLKCNDVQVEYRRDVCKERVSCRAGISDSSGLSTRRNRVLTGQGGFVDSDIGKEWKVMNFLGARERQANSVCTGEL
jgi:hypothetical protein